MKIGNWRPKKAGDRRGAERQLVNLAFVRKNN
jgi:hypothetical protein